MILSDLKLHSVPLRALPQASIRHASIEQDLGMGFPRGPYLVLSHNAQASIFSHVCWETHEK